MTRVTSTWGVLLHGMHQVCNTGPFISRALVLKGELCRAQGLLERDPAKRLTAAAALEMAWVREGGCAPTTPLEGTVVQRLQRHATYGHLKQARCFTFGMLYWNPCK